jgi:hypothetical protein
LEGEGDQAHQAWHRPDWKAMAIAFVALLLYVLAIVLKERDVL